MNHTICLADYYENCSSQEYAEVNDEILMFLEECRRQDKKQKMQDYRHLTTFSFDEIYQTVDAGFYEKSAEDAFFENLHNSELYAALHQLSQKNFRRFYLYHVVGMKQEQIAELEGVSHEAISRSLKNTAENLRKILYSINKQ